MQQRQAEEESLEEEKESSHEKVEEAGVLGCWRVCVEGGRRTVTPVCGDVPPWRDMGIRQHVRGKILKSPLYSDFYMVNELGH